MGLFRRRFADLISRQLALFAEEHAELLDDCRGALGLYTQAGREEAGEHYERFGDLQEELNDALHNVRDSYAATLDDDLADRYVEDFDRAAARRFRDIWL